MAITNAQTTRWAAAAKVIAQENSIVGTITSGAYQTLAEGAKTITVVGVDTPTVDTYTPGTPLTYEALTDNTTDIDIDQFRKFGFTVNDVDVAQSTPDFVPPAITQASNTLALEADKYVFGMYTQANAGNVLAAINSATEITASNVLAKTSALATKLRENHVNRGDMWLVIPPWYMDLLSQAVGARLTDNATVMSFGEVYHYAGLNIVESTEVPSELGTGADETIISAFSSRALPFVSQIQKVETLKNPDDFGDIIRALYGFGSKVMFPKELAYMAAKPYVDPEAISITGILGVTAPATGGTPVTAITASDEYTGTVAWSPVVATTFVAETAYTATVTLTAKDGYTVTGVAENSFTVAGATATNPANSGVVSALFPATEE